MTRKTFGSRIQYTRKEADLMKSVVEAIWPDAQVRVEKPALESAVQRAFFEMAVEGVTKQGLESIVRRRLGVETALVA